MVGGLRLSSHLCLLALRCRIQKEENHIENNDFGDIL